MQSLNIFYGLNTFLSLWNAMKTNGGAQVWFICTVRGEMCYWSYSPIPSHPVSLAIPLWIIDVTTMSPSLPPSPSPLHTSPLQGSPSLTESPKNRLHTIPVTISNKAEQGEGQDAPWHLNQWLSYNNSMMVNLSLLPSSLQSIKQHTGFYHSREKQQKLNSFLDICSGISGQMAKMAS